MLICLAAPRPATAELAQIRNADLNLIDLARSTHPPTTSAIRSRTSISPLDRLASTHTPSPRRSNPHSARGTATPSLIAVSSLGGFPTPALRARGTVIIGPASENLHTSGLGRRSKQHRSISLSGSAGNVDGPSIPSGPGSLGVDHEPIMLSVAARMIE